MTNIAGVGKKGITFPLMITKKTSRSGFPLNSDTRLSIKGKDDSGEPSEHAFLGLVEKATSENGKTEPETISIRLFGIYCFDRHFL